MHGQGILLPFVPGRRAAGHGQRPDQRSIDAGPDSAIFENSHLLQGKVFTFIHHHGADGRRLADQLVEGSHQYFALFRRGRAADDCPGLRLEPDLIFADPAQVWTQPRTAEPSPAPVFLNGLTLRTGFGASFAGVDTYLR